MREAASTAAASSSPPDALAAVLGGYRDALQLGDVAGRRGDRVPHHLVLVDGHEVGDGRQRTGDALGDQGLTPGVVAEAGGLQPRHGSGIVHDGGPDPGHPLTWSSSCSSSWAASSISLWRHSEAR